MAKPPLIPSPSVNQTPPPNIINTFAPIAGKKKGVSVNDLTGFPPSEDCYKFILVSPASPTADFYYNYFVRDERVKGDPIQQDKVPQDRAKKRVFLQKKPRYVKLSFSTPYPGQSKKIAGGIEQYASKIVQNNGNTDFLSVVFQDFNVLDSLRKNLKDSFPGAEADQKKKAISDLVTNSSAPLNSYFLSTLAAVPDDPEASTVQVGNETVSFNPYSDLGKESLISSINNKFYEVMLTVASMDTYSDHYDTPQASSVVTQQKNYGYFADPYTIAEPLNSKNNYTELLLAGYQVDRYVVDDSGIMSYQKSIILDQDDSAKSIIYYDTDVLYGVTYVYAVKAIYDAKLVLRDVTAGGYVTARYLVGSRHSDFTQVQCVKQHTPPPPGDIRFMWDPKESGLFISWCTPMNSMRDVKGFKVFKRSSINEPYQMVKMFDFNDAYNRYPLPDFLANSGVVQVVPDTDSGDKLPVISWYDHDFDPYGVQMYALVSYTAHNYDSTLSAQFQVTYNQVTGRAEMELVSRQGAPLAYPNIYVNRSSLFVNTMVSDGMDRLRIYFDPAARRAVKKSNGSQKSAEDLYFAYDPLAKTGRYVLNITNLDLLKHTQVDVKILNLEISQIV